MMEVVLWLLVVAATVCCCAGVRDGYRRLTVGQRTPVVAAPPEPDLLAEREAAHREALREWDQRLRPDRGDNRPVPHARGTIEVMKHAWLAIEEERRYEQQLDEALHGVRVLGNRVIGARPGIIGDKHWFRD